MKDNHLSLKLTLVYCALIVMLALIAGSCHSDTAQPADVVSTADSVLLQSNKNLVHAEVIAKKSDSVTQVVIEKKVEKLKYLKQLIAIFQKEREQVNTVEAVERVVYRVDTVFIETEKSFWGRKKTRMSVKSDSTVTENSSTSESVVIDTTNNN